MSLGRIYSAEFTLPRGKASSGVPAIVVVQSVRAAFVFPRDEKMHQVRIYGYAIYNYISDDVVVPRITFVTDSRIRTTRAGRNTTGPGLLFLLLL